MGLNGISYSARFPTTDQSNAGPSLLVLNEFHVSVQEKVKTVMTFFTPSSGISRCTVWNFFQQLFLKRSTSIHFSNALSGDLLLMQFCHLSMRAR